MEKAKAIGIELALAAGMALCLGILFGGGAMVYGRDPLFALQPLFAGAIWLAPCLAAVWIASLAMRALARHLGIEWERRDSRHAMLPLLGCLASLAQPLVGYADFTLALLVLAVAGSLWRYWTMLRRDGKPNIEGALEALGDGRTAALAAAAFLLLYAVVGLGVFSELPQPEGDEPHYLMVAYSLLADGDVELTNNYYETRDYLRWHDYGGDPVGYAHTKRGARRGEQYSMHSAGLPAYLAPFMAAGLQLGGNAGIHAAVRLGMAIPAAALIAMLLLTLRRLGLSRSAALGTAVLAGLTCPLLFFSYHVFTEIPAALCCLFAFHHLWGEERPHWLSAILTGAALGALPWLGPKYLALAAPLVVLWIVREIRWGFDWARALRIALPGLALGLLFFWHTWAIFGTPNPAAYYVGATGDITGKNPVFRVGHSEDLLDAARVTGKTALAYWIDQKEGLLAFAPWYLLGLAGWIAMACSRGQRRLAFWLLGIVAPFYITYAMTGFGGGHSPPARAMTAIIWAVLIPAAWLLPRALRRLREAVFALAALSLAISATLLLQPRLLYHDFHVRASQMLTALSTPFLDLTALAPSVNNKHFENWDVAAIWAVLQVAAVAWFVAEARSEGSGSDGRWAGIGALVLAAVAIAWSLGAVTPPLEDWAYPVAGSDSVVMPQRGAFHLEEGRFWVRTGMRGNCYLLSEDNSVELNLRSPVPNIVLVSGGLEIHEVRLVDRRHGGVAVETEGGFDIGRRRLSRFYVEPTSGVPAGSGLIEGENRDLGVEVAPARRAR